MAPAPPLDASRQIDGRLTPFIHPSAPSTHQSMTQAKNDTAVRLLARITRRHPHVVIDITARPTRFGFEIRVSDSRGVRYENHATRICGTPTLSELIRVIDAARPAFAHGSKYAGTPPGLIWPVVDQSPPARPNSSFPPPSGEWPSHRITVESKHFPTLSRVYETRLAERHSIVARRAFS